MKCIECKTKEAVYEKSQLCSNCYQKMRKEKILGKSTEICISCKKNKIFYKSRKLCNSCYHKLARSKKLEKLYPKTNSTIAEIHFKAEMDFVKNYFINNNDWVYQPATFNLNGMKYTPDFYDIKKNIFIEVVGSKQAFYANREKYILLKQLFPKIKFEVRHSSGHIYRYYHDGEYKRLRNMEVDNFIKKIAK